MPFPFMAAALAASAAATAYGVHRSSRSATKDRSINKRGYKRSSRQMKRYEKDIASFMKKYGGEKYKNYSAMNPGQNALLKSLLNKGNPLPNDALYQGSRNYLQGNLANTPASYDAYKAPIMQEFRESVLPEILSRYGGVAPEQSSALQNELSRAGTDVQSRLASLRAELQSNAAGQGLSHGLDVANLGLGARPYNSVYRPPTPPISPSSFSALPQRPSALSGFVSGASEGIGQGIGSGLGQGIANRFSGYGGGSGQSARPAAASPIYNMNQMGGRRMFS